MTIVKPSAIAAALIVPMFAAGLWALWRVGTAARVPIHFDINGRPNNDAPAWIGLFILPAVACFLWLLPALLPRIDPRGENVLRSERAVRIIILAAIVVVAAAQAMIVAATLGVRVDTTHLVGVLVGSMFVVAGNMFGKLRWNYTNPP